MNPILQALSGATNKQNNIMGLLSMLKNGNPNVVFNQMMQTNPQFRSFVEANKGKNVEQIAQENGIDLSMLKSFLK